MKLKDAIEMIIAAVEQEDMVISFALEFPIKRLKLEVERIKVQELVYKLEHGR